MKYTEKQLEQIFKAHEKSGPRGAYFDWFGYHPLPGNKGTNDVEDFIIDFYNKLTK
jgi:hypothetical protein